MGIHQIHVTQIHAKNRTPHLPHTHTPHTHTIHTQHIHNTHHTYTQHTYHTHTTHHANTHQTTRQTQKSHTPHTHCTHIHRTHHTHTPHRHTTQTPHRQGRQNRRACCIGKHFKIRQPGLVWFRRCTLTCRMRTKRMHQSLKVVSRSHGSNKADSRRLIPPLRPVYPTVCNTTRTCTLLGNLARRRALKRHDLIRRQINRLWVLLQRCARLPGPG